MSWLIGKFKLWWSMALGITVWFIYTWYLRRSRKRARKARDRALHDMKVEAQRRNMERQADEAAKRARMEARENAKRKLEERRSGTAPGGNVADRLRDDQN